MGLASNSNAGIQIMYEDFVDIHRLNLELTRTWTEWSPFLLQIDRVSDIGRQNFCYQYRFLLGANVTPIDRRGYYVRRSGTETIYHLDDQTYALLTTMDQFNDLRPEQKTKSASWLSFARLKGCAESVGAQLDRYLASNDVVIPSRIALEIYANRDGSISFVPKCKELPGSSFRDAFLRNPDEQGVYSIDLDGQRRIRVVLDDRQQEVLHRMKQVRQFTGESKRNAIEHPEQFFDGVLESVVLPYGRRVEGVGEFQFVSTPHVAKAETIFGDDAGCASKQQPSHVKCVDSVTRDEVRIDFPNLRAAREFREKVGVAIAAGVDGIDYDGEHILIDQELYRAVGEAPTGRTTAQEKRMSEQGKKYLLIYTDDGELKEWDKQDAARARIPVPALQPFERPKSLSDEHALKEHQKFGIQWLQGCHRLIGDGRRGSLLADDMGLGKTLQILAYLAWCIESDHDLNLSAASGPWRPILIVMPLVLLENEVWQKDMKKFFKGQGSVFEPILSFHGNVVKQFMRTEAEGREVTLWKSVLDVTKFQQYRVVITNYETIVNYQYSFAQLIDGESIWSVVITDEAQEYKTPNSKISHAIKALAPSFRLASTGTPVENTLLDLWNLIDAQQPALLGTAKQFSSTYESGHDDTTAARGCALRTELLFGKANAFVLRRDKTEVLRDFPEKKINVVECWMSDSEVAMHADLLKMLPEHRRCGTQFKILDKLIKLYQHPQLLKNDQGYLDPARLTAESSKLRGVIEILHNIKRRREKAIIFSHIVNMQQILAAVLSAEFDFNVEIINGSQNQQRGIKSSETTARTKSARQQKLDKFGSKPGFNVIILSPFVAGIGLTITEANHVIHYGRWWNPAIEAQATDRVYRMGQTKDVCVYLPILKDREARISSSFDERLHALLERKSRLAHDFLTPLGDSDTCGTELCDSLMEEQSNQSISSEPLSMDDIDRLSPIDFEAAVAVMFEKKGYDSILTAKGNDGGADVISFRAGEITLIQVKHSRSAWLIGREAIGDLIGASTVYNVSLRNSLSLRVVTNSKLAIDAENECREQGIGMITRSELARDLREHPITLAQVLSKAEERCSSFSEGVRKLQNMCAER
jgi:hypothetical protein